MKKSLRSRLAALIFFLIFTVCAFPISAAAADVDESKLSGYRVVSEREWQLSPGVTESEIVLQHTSGDKRQVTHVVEIDVTDPYTKVIPSYYKMAEGLAGKEYQTQIMSEQVKYAEENGYGNVVAAMNTCLHWYDTDYYKQHPELIGEPLGTLILDGVRYTNSQNTYFGAYTCIVINFDEKDGQPRPDSIPKIQVRQTYDAITGWEEQLIPASFHFLVKDGVNQHSVNDPEPFAPRTMMGVKSDGTLVLVMVEGRQAPFSTGFNAYEMAEYMISLGCVQAINCDGGGSSTFLSERPGEELALHCSPSDGAERPVAHGVLVISTLPASHVHTPGEKTDKEPTSAEPGYTGRVFCTECGAVIEEGTEFPTVGHTYSVDLTNKKIVCDCGCTFDKTGLQSVGGKNYYTVKGNLQSGWMLFDDAWYYFDPTSFAGADGSKTADNGVTFTFDGGRVTEGTWVKNASGTRYWYGPGYYRDTSTEPTSSRPYEIGGKTYLFNQNGYMQTGLVKFYNAKQFVYYRCGENGEAEILNGVHKDQLYLDGVLVRCYQLVKCNGDFYFVSDSNKIARNTTVYLGPVYIDGKTYADGSELVPGYYTFDADGKMVIKTVPETPDTPPENRKNGVIDGYLYINDVKQTRYKLVEYDGNLYFINDGDKVARSVKLFLSAAYVSGKTLPDGTALAPGYYTFDAEGRMVVENTSAPETPEPPEAPPTAGKNGVIDGYLYINDVKQTRYKLVKYNGNFYFVNDGDKIAKNMRLYLSATYVSGKTFPDGRSVQPGYYYFDSEGRMIIESAKNGVVGDYLYVNDVKQTRYKLVEHAGSFYFINDGDKIARNMRLYLNESFVSGKTLPDGTALKPGYYRFDSLGRMIIESAQNGVIDGLLYINGVKQTRYKLVEYDGNLYFINDGDKVAVNMRLYLSATYVSGKTFPDGRAVQPGYYRFDGEGRMIVESAKNGVVGDYLYINDAKQTRYKLVMYDNHYYFINDGDKIAKSMRLYLNETFVSGKTLPDGSALKPGFYYFDAEGKMIVS